MRGVRRDGEVSGGVERWQGGWRGGRGWIGAGGVHLSIGYLQDFAFYNIENVDKH